MSGSWSASKEPGRGSTPSEVPRVRPAAVVVSITLPLPDAIPPGLPGSILDLCPRRRPGSLSNRGVLTPPQQDHGPTIKPESGGRRTPLQSDSPAPHDSPAAGVGPVKSTGLVSLLAIAFAAMSVRSSGPTPLRIGGQSTLSAAGWVAVLSSEVTTSSSGL